MFYSILIPVYNVEKYLEECVHSVLKQGEKDYEILLLDDGSTDGSSELCDKLADKYPSIIRVIHKDNEGLLLTRRRGLKEAKGEWIVHLDSDDYMMPNVLEKVREVIEKTSVDLIIGKIAYGENDGITINRYSKLPFSDMEEIKDKKILIKNFLLSGEFTSLCQKIARRDIINIDDNYIQYSNVNIAEDYLQSLPILDKCHNTIFLDYPFIYYRKNDESMTKKKNYLSYQKSFWSKIAVFEKEQEYLSLWNIPAKLRAIINTRHMRSLCYDIKKILCVIEKKEKTIVYNEIKKIKNCKTWKFLFVTSNKKSLGLFSKLCYYLIYIRCIFLLRLVCLSF